MGIEKRRSFSSECSSPGKVKPKFLGGPIRIAQNGEVYEASEAFSTQLLS